MNKKGNRTGKRKGRRAEHYKETGEEYNPHSPAKGYQTTAAERAEIERLNAPVWEALKAEWARWDQFEDWDELEDELES